MSDSAVDIFTLCTIIIIVLIAVAVASYITVTHWVLPKYCYNRGRKIYHEYEEVKDRVNNEQQQQQQQRTLPRIPPNERYSTMSYETSGYLKPVTTQINNRDYAISLTTSTAPLLNSPTNSPPNSPMGNHADSVSPTSRLNSPYIQPNTPMCASEVTCNTVFIHNPELLRNTTHFNRRNTPCESVHHAANRGRHAQHAMTVFRHHQIEESREQKLYSPPVLPPKRLRTQEIVTRDEDDELYESLIRDTRMVPVHHF